MKEIYVNLVMKYIEQHGPSSFRELEAMGYDADTKREIRIAVEALIDLGVLRFNDHLKLYKKPTDVQDGDAKEVLKLSKRDSKKLLEALIHPREPNEALKKAFKHHDKTVKEIL